MKSIETLLQPSRDNCTTLFQSGSDDNAPLMIHCEEISAILMSISVIIHCAWVLTYVELTWKGHLSIGWVVRLRESDGMRIKKGADDGSGKDNDPVITSLFGGRSCGEVWQFGGFWQVWEFEPGTLDWGTKFPFLGARQNSENCMKWVGRQWLNCRNRCLQC